MLEGPIVGEELGIRNHDGNDRHPRSRPCRPSSCTSRTAACKEAERYQSAAEMVEVLQVILEGRAECSVTLIKRASPGRFVDRYPPLAALGVRLAIAASVVASGVRLVQKRV